MKAAMFDTLEYMDDLKNSGMKQEQAEAMTKAMAKAFSQMLDNQQLASKVDLSQVETKLTSEIKRVETAVKQDILNLKMELQAFIVKSVITTIGVLGGLQALFHFIK